MAFGFAQPISRRLPINGPAPTASSMAPPQMKGATPSLGQIKSGLSSIQNMLHGGPPSTPYISSPMLPAGPDIGDMSGAASQAVGNVTAGAPAAADVGSGAALDSAASAAAPADAAASAAPDIASLIAELFL
jgi:hypothetical protein